MSLQSTRPGIVLLGIQNQIQNSSSRALSLSQPLHLEYLLHRSCVLLPSARKAKVQQLFIPLCEPFLAAARGKKEKVLICMESAADTLFRAALPLNQHEAWVCANLNTIVCESCENVRTYFMQRCHTIREEKMQVFTRILKVFADRWKKIAPGAEQRY